ncbi:hypothetical protein FV218_12640 [Methylobacterium sp. WL69]|jgi:hypothetical protein|uniref:hypothetical protein n=1 Tax=Methylobacterium sp. WL69 TaxID=2603893 RepID=UPI0011C73969|nr:hypothetical protein [Methylobacterium sp. WL69]TXM72710.1 hypothetical protein FV218_12640 [Methylobacterium sp. WL69]
MPRRAAVVTQADIARAIRAVQAAGLPVMRVIVRSDGVAVETVRPPDQNADPQLPNEVANNERVVVL